MENPAKVRETFTEICRVRRELREAGGDICAYYKPNDIGDFTDQVDHYLQHEEEYARRKEMVGEAKFKTWDECAKEMYEEVIKVF